MICPISQDAVANARSVGTEVTPMVQVLKLKVECIAIILTTSSLSFKTVHY